MLYTEFKCKAAKIHYSNNYLGLQADSSSPPPSSERFPTFTSTGETIEIFGCSA